MINLCLEFWQNQFFLSLLSSPLSCAFSKTCDLKFCGLSLQEGSTVWGKYEFCSLCSFRVHDNESKELENMQKSRASAGSQRNATDCWRTKAEILSDCKTFKKSLIEKLCKITFSTEKKGERMHLRLMMRTILANHCYVTWWLVISGS